MTRTGINNVECKWKHDQRYKYNSIVHYAPGYASITRSAPARLSTYYARPVTRL